MIKLVVVVTALAVAAVVTTSAVAGKVPVPPKKVNNTQLNVGTATVELKNVNNTLLNVETVSAQSNNVNNTRIEVEAGKVQLANLNNTQSHAKKVPARPSNANKNGKKVVVPQNNVVNRQVNVKDAAKKAPKNFTFIKRYNPIAKKIDLVTYYNYTGEEHWVTTQDGYNLTLIRITGNKTHPSAKGKPSILLQHGLFCSPIDWLITGPERSLALILVDRGFDVWLGSSRGSVYSRRHNNFTLEDAKFWDFSWHEMGMYDIPAVIDYIREKNGMRKIYYVGHSQGTTQFYVMLSERPEYNEKIEMMISLAPVAYFKGVDSLTYYLAKALTKLYDIAISFKLDHIDPFEENKAPFLSKLCNSSETSDICKKILFQLFGIGDDQYDEENYSMFLRYFPAGSSLKQLVHYAQLMKSGYFRQFDYDKSDNLMKYKTLEPPSYKLTNVRVPLLLFYGDMDPLTKEEDVNTLYIQLGGKKTLPRKIVKFNHVDFLYGKTVKTKVYDLFIPVLLADVKEKSKNLMSRGKIGVLPKKLSPKN